MRWAARKPFPQRNAERVKRGVENKRESVGRREERGERGEGREGGVERGRHVYHHDDAMQLLCPRPLALRLELVHLRLLWYRHLLVLDPIPVDERLLGNQLVVPPFDAVAQECRIHGAGPFQGRRHVVPLHSNRRQPRGLGDRAIVDDLRAWCIPRGVGPHIAELDHVLPLRTRAQLWIRLLIPKR